VESIQGGGHGHTVSPLSMVAPAGESRGRRKGNRKGEKWGNVAVDEWDPLVSGLGAIPSWRAGSVAHGWAAPGPKEGADWFGRLAAHARKKGFLLP
jgi:hypothetical protein